MYVNILTYSPVGDLARALHEEGVNVDDLVFTTVVEGKVDAAMRLIEPLLPDEVLRLFKIEAPDIKVGDKVMMTLCEYFDYSIVWVGDMRPPEAK